MKSKHQIKHPTVEHIIDIYCATNNVDRDFILSKTRKRKAITHIQNLAHFMVENLKLEVDYATMGLSLGNRDHATIVHAKKTALNLIEIDKDFRIQYEICISNTMSELPPHYKPKSNADKLLFKLKLLPKFTDQSRTITTKLEKAYSLIDEAILELEKN